MGKEYLKTLKWEEWQKEIEKQIGHRVDSFGFP
jgi:hypothetical protein